MREETRALGEFDELPEDNATRWEALCEFGDTKEIRPVVNEALAVHGLYLTPTNHAYRRLCLDARKVTSEAFKIESDRWGGRFGHGQMPPPWIDETYPLAPALVTTICGQPPSLRKHGATRTSFPSCAGSQCPGRQLIRAAMPSAAGVKPAARSTASCRAEPLSGTESGRTAA